MSKLTSIKTLIYHPLGRRLVWLAFAVLFYLSGEAFTIWLLSPEEFAGGLRWIWVGLFPLLIPAFFIVQRLFGCASGYCDIEQHKAKDKERVYHQRPPGI